MSSWFMLMKKLRLDPHEESMLLTTTGGNLELEKVEKAVQAVFPEGKGHATKGSTKEVFQAEAPRTLMTKKNYNKPWN